MKRVFCAVLCCFIFLAVGAKDRLTMVVGTYTGAGSNGIYSFDFDQDSGEAKLLSSIDAVNPSYLAIDDNGSLIYSVNENGVKSAAVDVFTLDKKNGMMRRIDHRLTRGDSPCYIAVNGDDVLTANYGGGSISSFKRLKSGVLSENNVTDFNVAGKSPARLHCVVYAPDKNTFFACNLGNDCIYKCRITAGKGVEVVETYNVAKGSGPSHIVFSPNSKHAYAITEKGGTVIAFHYDGNNLKEFQTVIADSLNARGSADIRISPDGKFLYASNRLKGDGVAIFAISKDGLLSKVGYQDTGLHPRNFMITPNGKFLLAACRDSGKIQVFKRDIRSGMLKNTNKDILLSKPVCIQFVK